VNDSTVLPTTTTPYVYVPNVVALPDIKLPNVVHPVGATRSVDASTRQSDEEVDISRRQRLSHASSPTPSLEDYKIGPGDLTVFPADPIKICVPGFFEPIATRLKTTRPREATNVPMTPAAIGNLTGATKRDSRVLRKHLQPLTKRASKKKVVSKK
jgi:hypothetical protein